MSDLAVQLNWLAASYQTAFGRAWQHFHCPILCVEERVELCLGHVVPNGLPSSTNATIVQRKDVDNLFGRSVNAVFVDCARAFGKPLWNVVQDPNLRKIVRPHLEIAGLPIEYYEVGIGSDGLPTGHIGPGHALLRLENEDGTSKLFALKASPQQLADLEQRRHIEVVSDVDCRAATIGSLLHSAHLTMFKLLGYAYAHSTAGILYADILRTFVRRCAAMSSREIRCTMQKYFLELEGYLFPLSAPPEWARGTVDDNQFLVMQGIAGQFTAFGVLISTAGMMHVVWMPWGKADSAADFLAMTKTTPQQWNVQHAELVCNDDGGRQWRCDNKVLTVQYRSGGITPYFRT
jgi:hypothetical protein